jgi:flagellar basal-body rod modification protein FlgD
MQIQNQNPVLFGANSAAAETPTKPASFDALANEATFMQLLVSQLRNQDPLNPTDSTQFLSQLTQMSQLEQLVAIRQTLQGNGASGAGATANTGVSRS